MSEYKVRKHCGHFELWVPESGKQLRNDNGEVETFNSYSSAKFRLYSMNNALYFVECDDMCYPIQRIIDNMKEDKIDMQYVYKAEKEVRKVAAFCAKYGELIIINDSYCGKGCDYYNPKNHKNGCCKYRRNCYVRGECYRLYESGRLEKLNK